MDESTQRDLEAAAFRRLVSHLQERTDAQNIDMMNLAGFAGIASPTGLSMRQGMQALTLIRQARARWCTACPMRSGRPNISARQRLSKRLRLKSRTGRIPSDLSLSPAFLSPSTAKHRLAVDRA